MEILNTKPKPGGCPARTPTRDGFLCQVNIDYSLIIQRKGKKEAVFLLKD